MCGVRSRAHNLTETELAAASLHVSLAIWSLMMMVMIQCA